MSSCFFPSTDEFLKVVSTGRQVLEVVAAHRKEQDVGGFARTLHENTCRYVPLVFVTNTLECTSIMHVLKTLCFITS